MSLGGQDQIRYSVLFAWCGVWLYIRLCHLMAEATPYILCCLNGEEYGSIPDYVNWWPRPHQIFFVVCRVQCVALYKTISPGGLGHTIYSVLFAW